MPRSAKPSTVVKPYVRRTVSAKRKLPELSLEGRNVPELKWNDLADFNVVADTTGAVTLLNGMVRGLDASANRIGRKIFTRQILIRGECATNSANTSIAPFAGAQLARIIVVYDKDANGATPAVTDILSTANARSQFNLNNRDRFRILYDKTANFGASQGTNSLYANACQQLIDINMSVNLPTIYNSGNAGTSADINHGAIYLVTVGTTAASATLAANFDLTTRIRFNDA